MLWEQEPPARSGLAPEPLGPRLGAGCCYSSLPGGDSSVGTTRIPEPETYRLRNTSVMTRFLADELDPMSG